MAKKSASRLQRDAIKKDQSQLLKNNACWDDLNQMYLNMTQLLSQHSLLAQIASNADIIAAVEDKVTLAQNIQILANDLRALNNELSALHNLHAHKTGGTTDPDELIGTIGIYEQYVLFMERHDAVVIPTTLHITEQLNLAEQLVAENAKPKAGDVDADGIVEADFTEVVKAEDEPFAGAVHESVNPPDFNKLMNSFNEMHATPISAVVVNDESNTSA